MKLTIQSIHCAPKLKFIERLSLQLQKLTNKYPLVRQADVYLLEENNKEGKNQIMEIFFKTPGQDFFAKGRGDSFEVAAKESIEGIRHQLEKQKVKILAH